MLEAPKGSLRKAPPTPKFIKEKPHLDIGLIWIWDSFLQLNSTRLKDFAEIPWTAIDAYCKRWGVNTPEEFDSFVFFIREIDKAYLEETKKVIDKHGHIRDKL